MPGVPRGLARVCVPARPVPPGRCRGRPAPHHRVRSPAWPARTTRARSAGLRRRSPQERQRPGSRRVGRRRSASASASQSLRAGSRCGRRCRLRWGRRAAARPDHRARRRGAASRGRGAREGCRRAVRCAGRTWSSRVLLGLGALGRPSGRRRRSLRVRRRAGRAGRPLRCRCELRCRCRCGRASAARSSVDAVVRRVGRRWPGRRAADRRAAVVVPGARSVSWVRSSSSPSRASISDRYEVTAVRWRSVSTSPSSSRTFRASR